MSDPRNFKNNPSGHGHHMEADDESIESLRKRALLQIQFETEQSRKTQNVASFHDRPNVHVGLGFLPSEFASDD